MSFPPSRTPRACRLALAALPLLSLIGCHRNDFPTYPANYREYAYVTDGATGSVAVLDLVYLRRDRLISVGKNPTGVSANPVRNEVYVANTGSDNISVIDTNLNVVTNTLAVGHMPYFVEVAPDGHRAYVPNAGSGDVAVLDLDHGRRLATIAAGQGPGVARLTHDNRTLVVSNRAGGSVSIYAVHPDSADQPLTLRSTFSGCPGATDIAIVSDPNSPKAFVACSASHQVMALWLAAAPDSWRGKQDPTLTQDHKLAMLDVGRTPTHLALKADSGEVFSTNFDSDSISEMSTWTNEVEGTYVVGTHPSQAVCSRDNSSLWISDFGGDAVSLYSIDDGRVEATVHTGSGPDSLAFSADEHLLLVADSHSGDVAVIRTAGRNGPELLTLLPAGNQPNAIAVKSFTVK